MFFGRREHPTGKLFLCGHGHVRTAAFPSSSEPDTLGDLCVVCRNPGIVGVG